MIACIFLKRFIPLYGALAFGFMAEGCLPTALTAKLIPITSIVFMIVQ